MLRVDPAPPWVFIFDIDGTLLRCGMQVRPLFAAALRETFGEHATLDGFEFSGKLDPQIILELVTPTGRPREEILGLLGAMRETYLARLEAGLRREGMVLLPGVEELLARLGAREGTLVGLLTGNWRGGADVKLSRFDLGRHFRFGAFGDDTLERRALVPVALKRASKIFGRNISADSALIIGDSPRDVDCARAAGVRCLAVATGLSSEEQLRQAGADWVFPNLVEAASELPFLNA